MECGYDKDGKRWVRLSDEERRRLEERTDKRIGALLTEWEREDKAGAQ